MINIYKSPKGWISFFGIYLGLFLIIVAAFLSLATQSIRFWPLLAAGLIIGFISTPFYYYFKARDLQPRNPYQTPVDALAEAGRQADFKRRTTKTKEVKPEPIYPWDRQSGGKTKAGKNN